MKQFLFLSLFTIFISQTSIAATGMEKGVKPEKENYLYNPLGYIQTHVFLGATLFNLSGDVDSDAKPGVEIGVNAEIGQGLVWIAGLTYSNFKSEAKSPSTTIDFTTNYIGLNLGAKFYVSGSNSGFYFRGGLVPQILISAKPDNADFEDFDLMPQLGLGFVIPGSSTSFSIDLDYSIGLLNIADSDAVDTKNRGLSLSFGLLF